MIINEMTEPNISIKHKSQNSIMNSSIEVSLNNVDSVVNKFNYNSDFTIHNFESLEN